MTIGYLKRMRDQFLEEYEKHLTMFTDKAFAEGSLRIARAVLDAFVAIIEEKNK